jgi:hypothetical protein
MNMGGPHLRTMQMWRGHMSNYLPGRLEQNMDQLVSSLKKRDLLDVPGVWSEDATTCLKGVSACLDGLEGKGMEVYVEGFPEPIIIKCVKDLNDAFAKYGIDGLATYVYVWTWVPQIPHAPFFPVFWVASNNRFNAEWVWDWWLWLFRVGREKGLKAIGDVADGDARLRKCEYELNVHNKLNVPTQTLDHPLVFMHISIIDGMPTLGFQDWMHASGFRARRQPLDLVHNFQFGEGAEFSLAHLRPFIGEHLTEKDLDYHEKQHWGGCMKLFSEETIRKLTVVNDRDEHKSVRGTLAYIKFGFRLLQCHIGQEAGADATDRRRAVIDAAFCCGFVLYWRWNIVRLQSKGFSLKKHFMTRETFLDVLTLTQTSILVRILYREWYPKYKVHGLNLSSRFSEYVFQYCRMHETNSPLFDIAGFRRHLKHFLGQMELAIEGHVQMPPSKRGVPNRVEQVEKTQYEAPEGWHLTDAELKECIDEGLQQVCDIFINLLGCTEMLDMDLCDPKHFFSAPCKHFPDGRLKDDEDDSDGDNDDAPSGGCQREDSQHGADGDEDANCIAPTEHHVNIATRFNEICEKKEGLLGDEVQAPPETRMQLLKAVSDPLKTFNAGVATAKSDRRFGRMEEQAFRNVDQDRDAVDKWDYYSCDDDVLIVERILRPVTCGKGKGKGRGAPSYEELDVFIHGCVIDTALLRIAQRKRKTPLKDVDLMDKHPRARIVLNDSQGALFLKKYKETNENGVALEGYQNSRRVRNKKLKQKYHSLPPDAGEPVAWYSTSSVIGHVRMKRVDRSLTREICYDRNPSDFKDLIDKYHKEMVEAGSTCYCKMCKEGKGDSVLHP